MDRVASFIAANDGAYFANARTVSPGLVRLPVRQSFAFAAANCKDRTFSIGNLTGVIPELKFSEIPVQIFLRTVLIIATHPTLKAAEKSFR